MFLRAFAALTRAVCTAAIMMVMAFGGGTALAEKYAAIVIDADTQQVLHDRHADEPRYPASLTKVMTLYMLFDALKSGEVSLDERMVVSRYAAAQAPSNLKLRTGSRITVRDAIGALITKSANDVAVVVAERLGGTESRFAQLMTVKAKSLGLENTRFVNASGLPDTRQLSTARDMALLADAMLTDHADYYHYFATEKFSWGGKTYKNHNNLLGDVDGVDGIKTGYTRASGFNLMASAKRDGHRIIAVMLGGTTARARDRHVEALLEAAFSSYSLPADDPELRTRLAFAMLEEPLSPEAAAEPMLNGKPLSVILAHRSRCPATGRERHAAG
jgi:D-alanyl-D-alanine carboxypeptidase